MEKKIKVALVTWLGTGNFGTSLQSYALHEKVKEMGYDVCFLHPFVLPGVGSITYPQWILHALMTWLRRLKLYFRSQSEKQQRIAMFNRDNYHHKYVCSHREYQCLLSEVDVFMTGSDQIWNCRHTFEPFMFLAFVGGGKRVAYASSLGTAVIPEVYEERVKKLLEPFSSIAVREKQAVSYLSSLLDKEISWVLDPTFLLTSESWKDFARKAKVHLPLPDKYILCYFVGNRPEYVAQLKHVQKETGIKDIVLLPSLENGTCSLENTFVDEAAGPYEFVRYIIDASFVCTDSFHACALSINLEKDFVVFKRFEDGDTCSQNGRIYDLLFLFHLQERLYNRAEKNWVIPIDYTAIEEIVKQERLRSENYLIHAIGK